MRLPVLVLALLAAFPAPAEEDATLVATRSLRARTVVSPDDVALSPGATPGALTHPEDAIGMETRVAVYAGRPVMPGDLGPPALVDRNQIVTMRFVKGGLLITAEGRSLGRGGVGERVRVMNLDSRTTVTGVVIDHGLLEVR
jgi:flagella basal body P-ring formation protein FlgA